LALVHDVEDIFHELVLLMSSEENGFDLGRPDDAAYMDDPEGAF
jgi:hypothetical protein